MANTAKNIKMAKGGMGKRKMPKKSMQVKTNQLPKNVIRKFTGKLNNKTEKIRTVNGISYVVPKEMK